MAIAVGNSTSGLTTTITRPAAASGDYIIAVALRDGSNNPPNIPSGWTAIQTKTGDSTGSVLAYIISDGTTPTDTFGSATSVVMTAYSGVTGIGASNQTTTVGTTINWSSLTLTGTNGGSWIVLGAVTRADGTTVSAETPPSGFVNRIVSTDTTDESAIHDSNGGVSSFAGASASIGGASTGNVGFALELLGAPSGGGGDTITVDTGALALAGQTVSVTESGTNTVSVTAGALAIAGQAGTVADSGSGIVSVTVGALALAGQTVTVADSGTEAITASAGALTIAGQTVTVSDSAGSDAVAVDAGSLSLAGQTVTVADSGTGDIAVATGALTITGQSVTVSDSSSAGVLHGHRPRRSYRRRFVEEIKPALPVEAQAAFDALPRADQDKIVARIGDLSADDRPRVVTAVDEQITRLSAQLEVMKVRRKEAEERETHALIVLLLVA